MHVADVTMFYAAQSGGVKRYLHAKREWLRARGHRHSLIVPASCARDAGDDVRNIPGLRLPGAAGYRMPLSRRPAFAAITSLAPDLVECGDAFACAGAAVDAAAALGVPAVAFCHADLRALAERFLGRGGARLGAAAMRSRYRAFDLVLAASRAAETSLRDAGIDRVARQPLGVDTRTFAPCRGDRTIRRRLGLAADVRLLVFAGRFAAEKNLDVAARAVDLLGARYRLVAIGSGNSPPRGAYTIVLPYVAASDELARLLASCDAFLHAGDRETFGLAAIEAMACGLPVVAADSGALAELVDERVGRRARPRDARALAAAIEAIFAGDLASMSCAARALACARYDWDSAFCSLLSHYRRLTGSAADRQADATATLAELR